MKGSRYVFKGFLNSLVINKLQEEGGDVQEIEMEVEEEADADKEDMKAREARKKVSNM